MQTQNSLGWKTTQDGAKQYLIREVPPEQYQKIERFVSRVQTCRHKLIAVPELIKTPEGEMLLRERREMRSLRDFLATKPSTKTKLYLLRQLSHALENLHTFVGLAHGSLHENCISISEEGDLLLGGISYNNGNLLSDKKELHNLIRMVLHEESEKHLVEKLEKLAPFRIRNQINQMLQNESWETIVSDWKKAIKTPPPTQAPEQPVAEVKPPPVPVKQEKKQEAKIEPPAEKPQRSTRAREEYPPRGRGRRRSTSQRNSSRINNKKGTDPSKSLLPDSFEVPKPRQLVYHQELDEDQKEQPGQGWQNPKIRRTLPPDEQNEWPTQTETQPKTQKGRTATRGTPVGRRTLSADRGKYSRQDRKKDLRNTGGWTTPRVQQIRNSIPPEAELYQDKPNPRKSGLYEQAPTAKPTAQEPQEKPTLAAPNRKVNAPKQIYQENLFKDDEPEDLASEAKKLARKTLSTTMSKLSGTFFFKDKQKNNDDPSGYSSRRLNAGRKSSIADRKKSMANRTILPDPADLTPNDAYLDSFEAFSEEQSSDVEMDSLEEWAATKSGEFYFHQSPDEEDDEDLESEEEQSSKFLLWARIATIVGGIALLNYLQDDDIPLPPDLENPSLNAEGEEYNHEPNTYDAEAGNNAIQYQEDTEEPEYFDTEEDFDTEELEDTDTLDAEDGEGADTEDPENTEENTEEAKDEQGTAGIEIIRVEPEVTVEVPEKPPKKVGKTEKLDPSRIAKEAAAQAIKYDDAKIQNYYASGKSKVDLTGMLPSHSNFDQEEVLDKHKDVEVEDTGPDWFMLSKKALKGELNFKEVTKLYQIPHDSPDFTTAQAIVLSHAQQRKDIELIDETFQKIFSLKKNKQNPIFLIAQAHHAFNKKDLDAAEEHLFEAEKHWNNLKEEQIPLLQYQRGMLIAHFTFVHYLRTGSEDSRLQAITQFQSISKKARRMGRWDEHNLAEDRIHYLEKQGKPTRIVQ